MAGRAAKPVVVKKCDADRGYRGSLDARDLIRLDLISLGLTSAESLEEALTVHRHVFRRD